MAAPKLIEIAPGLFRDPDTGGLIDPSTGRVLRGTEAFNVYCPIGCVHPWAWRPPNPEAIRQWTDDDVLHWMDPGWRAVRFGETYGRHTKAPYRGRRFILQPFQLAWWLELFGTVDDRGLRTIRNGFKEFGRKSGKSEETALLVLKFLFADATAGGEIYGAANDQEQAGQVFAVVKDMVTPPPDGVGHPELTKRAKVVKSTFRIINRRTGTFYWAIPSKAKDAEGFNATLVVGDEIHVWDDPELWDVLTTSSGTREQPYAQAITTSGEDTSPQTSLFGRLRDYSLKVLRGQIDDPTWISDIREVPLSITVKGKKIPVDWADERYWVLANPGLGTREDIAAGRAFRDLAEMKTKALQARHSAAVRIGFRRRYLNQAIKSYTALIPVDTVWDVQAPMRPGAELVGLVASTGLDLASTTDLAALICLIEDDDEPGAVDVIPFFWMPEDTIIERGAEDQVPYSEWANTRWDHAIPFDDWAAALGHGDVGDPERAELYDVWDKRFRLIQSTPGNVIDYSWIRATVDDVARVFDVREVAFDRYGATQLSTELQDAGLEVTPISQTIVGLTPATKELLARLKGKKIRHGNHPVLRWMAGNAVGRVDSNENVKPDKSKSTGRIDGIVALIMALDVATRSDTSPSVYETQGVDSA